VAAPKLVLNIVDSGRKSQLTAKDFQDAIGIAPALSVPFEPALFGEAANDGQMILEVGKSHRIKQPFEILTKMIAEKSASHKKSAKTAGGLRSWFAR
jgi:pilus assembly protein CpaE